MSIHRHAMVSRQFLPSPGERLEDRLVEPKQIHRSRRRTRPANAGSNLSTQGRILSEGNVEAPFPEQIAASRQPNVKRIGALSSVPTAKG